MTRALALGGLALMLGAAAPSVAAAKQRPNIVVVTTDDQTLASMNVAVMPNVAGLTGIGATEFTDAVATTPVCCPSRASLLTGQYAHNHGVLANTPGYADLRGKANTLPVWLRRAGYATAHVGKYLNRYVSSVDDRAEVPPGWDEWHTVLDPARKYVRYFGYRLAVNGEVKRVGKRPRDYITRVINRRAVRMVRERVPRRKPLYLQVDHRAPHTEAGVNSGGPCGGLVPPDPRDALAFAGTPLPRPPSFDEQDVSDKPAFVRTLPPISTDVVSRIELRYRCALASLLSVDRGIARIVAELRKANELGRTAIVFTSDNGFFFGEHRIPEQKTRPYEEALRVPLLIRAPRRALGAATATPQVTEPVANIDLAPTILDLAGAEPCRGRTRCRVLDGRSLTGLIRGDGAWPAERGILVEFDAGERARRAKVCRYQGVRAGGHTYVRHTAISDPVTGLCEPTEEVEHYDLSADPFQLENLYPAEPGSPQEAIEAGLEARREGLRGCAGVAGRDATLADRLPCE
ncbi:MAG TPA: sulfatase [Solirubrobacterales bacterium]|nr:sulfatase [Solirubrobacterales bacterium]